MFTGTRTYVQDDDRIMIVQNEAHAGRAAVIFENPDHRHAAEIGLTDERLAELRDKITAYLAAKQQETAVRS